MTATTWRRYLVPVNAPLWMRGPLYAHCDLELDHVTARVLGLTFRGKGPPPLPQQGAPSPADLYYTIECALKINEGEQQRIVELEEGIQAALRTISYALQCDSLDARESALREAHGSLTRVL